MQQPTVSIIIPAYNEEDSIEQCLQSCVEQSVLAEEIIVVDNNSVDATAEIVLRIASEYPAANIRLVEETIQGMVPARDRGLEEAQYDILGRIDADTMLESGWVAGVKEIFSDEGVHAATGPMLYHDMPLRKLGFKFDDAIRSVLHKTSKNHKFIFGSNMAIRRTVWQEVKPMIPPDDEDKFHEDINLALTLCEQEFNIAYSPLMAAAMSARRLEDSPKDFYEYVMRFERTFKAHELKSARARIPIFIYLLIYFPIRTVRKFYDEKTNRLTFKKLIEEGDFKLLSGRSKDDVEL